MWSTWGEKNTVFTAISRKKILRSSKKSTRSYGKKTAHKIRKKSKRKEDLEITIFKKTFLKRSLILATVACSIFPGNKASTQAATYKNLEIVPSEKAKEAALDDLGLTEKDLASKKKATGISEKLSELIPASVDDYAKQRASALIETVKKNPEDFGVTIGKNASLQIENPFIIYSAESLGKQDPIYYYPIANHNKIILVLSVMECNGDYTASISTDYAPLLNKLDYQNNDDYLFYEDGENLYAENNDVTKRLSEMPQTKDALSEKEEVNAEVFEDLSTKNKVDAILNSYLKESKTEETPEKDMPLCARGFSIKKKSNVRLNTSSCLVPQKNTDGTCWAASVATTVRYLNYPKYKSLSARNVADKMKIGYNKGGTIDDMRKALKKYGVTYKKPDYSQVGFATVQKNILAQKPLPITAFPKNINQSGHVVTIIGYTTHGGRKQITFHNSGTNACTSVEYKKSGTTFSYDNIRFRWEGTLRYK